MVRRSKYREVAVITTGSDRDTEIPAGPTGILNPPEYELDELEGPNCGPQKFLQEEEARIAEGPSVPETVTLGGTLVRPR